VCASISYIIHVYLYACAVVCYLSVWFVYINVGYIGRTGSIHKTVSVSISHNVGICNSPRTSKYMYIYPHSTCTHLYLIGLEMYMNTAVQFYPILY
jgi:hypothetical protein